MPLPLNSIDHEGLVEAHAVTIPPVRGILVLFSREFVNNSGTFRVTESSAVATGRSP